MKITLRDQDIELVHQGLRLLRRIPDAAYCSEAATSSLEHWRREGRMAR